MKRGDMLPPVPKQVANPRIRRRSSFTLISFELGQDAPCYPWRRIRTNMVWLWPICLPAICEKNRYTRWTLQLANVPVQHSLQEYRFLQPEEWIPKTREPEQACCQRWKSSMSPICHYSREFWRNNIRACVSGQRKLTACRQTQNSCLKDYGFGGMKLKQKQRSVSPCKNWFHRVCSPPFGTKWRRRQKTHMQRSLKCNVLKKK